MEAPQGASRVRVRGGSRCRPVVQHEVGACMGPTHHRFWLPLTRLGAFFVAVVVAGNVVLFAFRPSAADRSAGPDESIDYFAKKKKRLERQFYRTIEMFLGPGSSSPAKEKVGTMAPA